MHNPSLDPMPVKGKKSKDFLQYVKKSIFLLHLCRMMELARLPKCLSICVENYGMFVRATRFITVYHFYMNV